MAEWLQIMLGTLSVIAASASAIAAFLAWSIAKSQTSPKIMVTVEQVPEGSSLFSAVLRNIGSSPAFRVKASVESQRRSVTESGVLDELRGFFSHEWPMLAPGQVVSYRLDRDKVWKERNSGAQITVDVEYSNRHGTKPRYKDKFDVTPSWKDGQQLAGPSVWPHIDNRMRPVVDIARQSERHLANIAQALDKDNE